jgi:type I restriction enzyme M protein
LQGTFDNLPELLKAAGIKKLGKGAQKAVLAAFGERDPEAQPLLDDKGAVQADPDLREFENVPLSQDIQAYFQREVLPHVPDAWIDTDKRDEKDGLVGIVGYEINFNRHFYVYQPPRSLADIDAELRAVEAEIAALLGEVTT